MKRILFLSASIFLSVLVIFFVPLAIAIKPFLPYANYLLGVDKPTTYLILLGNDTEMRANGGFAGSYAKITLSTPDIRNLTSDISFQDIYVPNGQLAGHVTPPEPIQQAFGHGTWELANADWEPDFPTAATAIRWFLVKGNEINPDILAIVNLSTIKKVLDIVGPFLVPEYQATLTPDNLYLFLQGKSEVGFFPGSTQKKDALLTVGKAFFAKIKNISLVKKVKIAQLLYSDLVNQNILLNSTNTSFQNLLSEKNFSGVLKPTAFDSYSLVETNLGANKANAYITRQTNHSITASASGIVNHSVAVTWENSSPQANPNPPFQYGGDYLAYLRFYIPALAQNIQVDHQNASSSAFTSLSSDNYNLKSVYGFTEIGFFQTIPAGNSQTINLSYDLPLENLKNYTLAILKQHGLVTSPQTVHLFDQTLFTPLHSSINFH